MKETTINIIIGACCLVIGFCIAMISNDLYEPEIIEYEKPVLINDFDIVYDEADRAFFGNNESDRVNGFYSHKGYFCVITKGRASEEIARTTFHELAHYFVHTDTDHFLQYAGGINT
jgi:Zn-dependent peptidase ImmA (M78 family)